MVYNLFKKITDMFLWILEGLKGFHPPTCVITLGEITSWADGLDTTEASGTRLTQSTKFRTILATENKHEKKHEKHPKFSLKSFFIKWKLTQKLANILKISF